MPIEFKKTVAVCEDLCTIEEAEGLLTWLLDTPKGKINLKKCTGLHTAIYQVLMALNPNISALPEQESVKNILIAASLLDDY
ncbi:MAG: hypothetical protein ACI8UG_000285 [Gammaproteobacteria bacterium]|jgi:hypothetical protein